MRGVVDGPCESVAALAERRANGGLSCTTGVLRASKLLLGARGTVGRSQVLRVLTARWVGGRKGEYSGYSRQGGSADGTRTRTTRLGLAGCAHTRSGNALHAMPTPNQATPRELRPPGPSRAARSVGDGPRAQRARRTRSRRRPLGYSPPPHAAQIDAEMSADGPFGQWVRWSGVGWSEAGEGGREDTIRLRNAADEG